MKENSKDKLPIRCFRLSDEVIKRLRRDKPRGKSWDRYFKDVLSREEAL